MKAKDKYEEQQRQIEFQLALLKDKLTNHATDFKKHPSNWSFVGDLGNVLSKLKELNQFLNV